MKRTSIKTLVISLGLATFLAACVNDNNSVGGSSQYLTVASKKAAALGLQLSTTADYSTLRDVAKGNGIYVVVGDNGTIITSKDGSNWQPQDGVVSENLSGVTYNTVNKLFYAVGDAGLIISSVDGVNWTVYKNLTPSVKLNSVMSVKGDEIIAGESGNVFEIAVTSKRGMVTVRSLDEAVNATSTAFNGSDMMVIGTASGGLFYKTYSTFSTNNWLRTKTLSGMPVSDISYDALDSWFIATTLNGSVIQSSDGKTWSSPILVDPLGKSTINLNSIAIEPLTDRFLVVGGDAAQNAFVRFSSDFNQWGKDVLPAKYQIQKVRCFDATSCVAVGDKKTLLVANKKSDATGMDWKLIDLIQPAVEIKSPLNGAIEISTQPVIKLGFNKHVNHVSSTSISLREGSATGNIIPISDITASGNDFVFSPLVKLADSTKYVVVISDGITDDSNYKVPTTTFSFTTGDFTAPTVTELYPENNTNNIPVKPMVKLSFSELVKNVDATNITLHQDSPTGALIPISELTQDANNVYMFTPTVALKETTKYYVVVSGNVTDLHDNHLAATQFSFTTGDFTAPSVSIVSPSDNATSVVTIASVQIKFSESVVNVSNDTVIIRSGSVNGPAISIGYITPQANNAYTFSPVPELEKNTKYFVTFADGIKDQSGNDLIKTQFVFTTVLPATQNITFSPIVGVKVGANFDLTVNTNWAESVEVTLPSGMTTTDSKSKFTCNSNLSCKTTIKVGSTAAAGNYLIQAVGLKSAFKYVGTVPVTTISSYLVSVANTKKAEICQLNTTGVGNCTITDLSSVLAAGLYGTAVSPSGSLYLLTTNSGTNPGAGAYKCSISNLKVTNCVQQSATGNAGITGGTFSIDGKYFYYNDMSKSTVNMCKVATNGDLTSCVVAKSGLQTYVQRLTLNYNGNSLFVNTGAGVMSCIIDASTGMFSSCITNSASAGGTDVWGINFNLENTRIYTTRENTINMCNYTPATNQVSACVANTYTGRTTGIAFTPTMVILTNAAGNLQKCTADSTGKLVNCAALSGSTITATEGLAIFN